MRKNFEGENNISTSDIFYFIIPNCVIISLTRRVRRTRVMDKFSLDTLSAPATWLHCLHPFPSGHVALWLHVHTWDFSDCITSPTGKKKNKCASWPSWWGPHLTRSQPFLHVTLTSSVDSPALLRLNITFSLLITYV